MEFVKNLRWICRVCAVNMKEKCSELASVHIFGPAQINLKLRKYLGIEVNREDIMPKNICSVCYRRLEDIHTFARLATKTDRFLKVFVGTGRSETIKITSSDFTNRFQKEFAAFALAVKEENTLLRKKKSRLICGKPKATMPGSRYQPIDQAIDKPKATTHNQTIDKPKSTAQNQTIDKPKATSHTQTIAAKPLLPKIPPSTTVTSPLSPTTSNNNLEQKRQNLKAVLATSNASQHTPRIKVKSETDLLKSPQSSAKLDAIVQLPPRQQSIKAITIPQATPQVQKNVQTLIPIYDERLKLGQVVKDIDLLTLILKALKWPYTRNDIFIQIERLKETPFHTVIRCPSLLQDADLMQILNTILSPMLFQKPIETAPKPVLPGFVSYKLPAGLSVQLITEGVDETVPPYRQPDVSKSAQLVSAKPKSKRANQRRVKSKPKDKPVVLRSSSPIVIPSDDDSVLMVEVNVDPNLYFNADSESQENSSNDASKRIPKKQRRKEALVQRNTELVEDKPKPEPEIIVPDNVTHDRQQQEAAKEKQKEEVTPPTVLATVSPKPAAQTTNAEEVSEDEGVWADFKVIESPNETLETDKKMDTSCVKTEVSAAQNTSSESNLHHDDFSLKVEESPTAAVNNTNTTEGVIIKEEIVQDANCQVDAQSTPYEDIKPTIRKRGRPKRAISPTSCNNDERSNQVDEKVPAKKPARKSTANTPPSQQENSKRATRSRAVQSSMSLRNSNLRRRICKQCGQSFTLLTDFLDHRRMHIES